MAMGTEPGAIKEDIPRGAANVGAFISYIYGAHTCALYEIAKHTLVDEVRLFIFVAGLCSWWIVLAHVAEHVRGLHIQLFNQFCVIVQSSRGIFGVLLWNTKFLTTHHLLWTDLIY